MKLLQLNVWAGRLEAQITKLLKAEKPDIVCIQEAVDIEGGSSALFLTVEDVQAVLSARHVFMSPAFSINYMSRKAHFGNAIISKFPIIERETLFTGKQYIEDFEYLKHDMNIRNLQRAVLQLPDDTTVTVLNHHGHHINQHKNGDPETMRQCKLIARQIKKIKGKLIVAGDFNLARHSESLEQVNSLLTNLPLQAKLTTTRTPLTDKTEVCDYIFVNSEVTVKSFRMSKEIVSDHCALILEF